MIISDRGQRLSLTDRDGGVFFDLNADGAAERIPWTAPGSEDAILVIDRNVNGRIDDGTELFSNFAPQVPTDSGGRNGFNAMVFLDNPANGGDGDGLLTASDAGFHSLQLWVDENHDGISQARELRSLDQERIEAFDLDYRESKRRDRHGNLFRFIAAVYLSRPGHRRKWAVDVFFPRPNLDEASIALQ